MGRTMGFGGCGGGNFGACNEYSEGLRWRGVVWRAPMLVILD